MSLSSASGIFLVGFITIILFMVLSAVLSFEQDKTLPKVVHGQLNLSTLSLARETSVPLSGKWDFYWGQLLSPQEIEQNTISPHTFLVPSSWIGSSLNGEALPKTGYATYSTEITLDKVYPQLALFIPPIGSSYTVYINDLELSRGGVVGVTAEQSESLFNPGVYAFDLQSNKFRVTIAVSNHEYEWGGMWTAPRLGLPNALHEEQYRNILQATFIVGIFFTICVFNLIQFSLRPVSFQPLLIAAISFLLGLRELEQTQILQLSNVLELSFEASMKISFITFYATVFPIVAYLYTSFKDDFHRWVVYFLCSVSIVTSVLVLVTPVEIYSAVAASYQKFTVLGIFYILFGVVKTVINKRENANILFLGTVLMFGFILNDLLLSMSIINSVKLVNFGLVAFVMCQNYLTYLHFINASEQNKLLNTSLADKNASLEALSGSLEKQVDARTEDLAEANRKLAQLVNEDPLTCLLNRRGLMQHILVSKEAFDEAGVPFCMLLVDFDHFKRLNDSLGHDVGDIVLESGGLIMKSIAEEKGVVGRWGGEEFLILVQNATVDEAYILAEKVRVEISSRLSQEINSPVSISIGLAQYMQSDSIDKCIKRADEALYLGKQSGRNCVKVDALAATFTLSETTKA